MEFSIICQLETVEEEMLAADGFTEKWTTPLQDINQASQPGHLSRETRALVFQTASMVNTLAEFFLEFEQTHITLSVQFKDDMQEIYARTSLASDSTKFDHDFADNTPRLPCPPYIASAYKRLKNNFCKPYPSQADIRLEAERHLRNDSLIGSSLRVYGMDKIRALRPKFSTPTDVVKNTMDLALVKGSSHKEDLDQHTQAVDEEHITRSHEAAYGDNADPSSLSASSMGSAAALKALQTFNNSGGGGGQTQLISMAMFEASKLFDSSGGAASGSKQDAITGAAMTVMKLVTQGGGGGGGGIGGALSGMIGGGSSGGLGPLQMMKMAYQLKQL